MNNLIAAFGDIPFSTVIVIVAALVFLYGLYAKVQKSIVEEYDKQKEREEKLENIIHNIAIIQEHLAEETEERQKIMTEIEQIKEGQKRIEQKQAVEDDLRKKRAINSIRDTLIKSYNYYCNKEKNPMFAWSEMEKNAFDELFQDYENLGGNGYMHSEVQPAILSLKVIPMNDVQGISNLMHSRK